MALKIGDIVEGKYRIEQVLGEGGMGTVFEGVHMRINRRVAIKVLKSSVAQDATMVERFEREAQAASAVSSKHVVEIFDVGELDSGEHYMIMEHLEGESLSRRLRRLKRMRPNQIFPLAIELLEGLGAAHAAGIVHRDLKPANIFIARQEQGEVVKVLDFGVSKFAQLASEGFTHTGAIVGTPHYMAPEQTKGARHADHRSDLYAVGAVVFRALSGRTPIVAETIHELIAKLISTSAPPIESVVGNIDTRAAAIVDRSLAHDPDDRYQSAAELAAAMGAWLEGSRRDDDETTAISPASGEGTDWSSQTRDPPFGFTPSGVSHPAPYDSQPSAAAGAPSSPDLAAPLPAPTLPRPSRPTPLHAPAPTPVTAPPSSPAVTRAKSPAWTPAPAAAPPPSMPTPVSLPSAQQGSHGGAMTPAVGREPISIATPSPSALDSLDGSVPRRSSLPLVISSTVGAVVLVAALAAWLVSSGGPDPTEATPATSPSLAASPGDEGRRTAAGPRAGTSSAVSSTSAAPSTSASTSASSSASMPKPTPRATAPRPRPRPTATGRDIRTDI